MNHIIHKIESIKGTLHVPGDKSISHRALLLGALAEGTTEITNLSNGQDVLNTLSCLRKMGIQINQKGKLTEIQGKGLCGFRQSHQILDAGNSGTTMRLLSGILAAQSYTSIITGDHSLRKRPMNRIIQPLKQMGAAIDTEKGGYPPLKIQGNRLHPLSYASPVASAQVKSCILLAGLHVKGITSVTEPQQSRDHTERMLPCFGVPVKKKDLTVSITGPSVPKAASIDVPGDISSASFYIIAATLIHHSKLKLLNIGVNPTRTGLMDVLKQMGTDILQSNISETNNEPRADLTITHTKLHGIKIDNHIIPLLIDEIPILAVAATQADGTTTIHGAKELRVKESDRIHAIEMNLKAMGIQIKTVEDGFSITGPQPLKGASIESFNDHRIAMAFAVAGLLADGQTVIQNSECVEISYPGFFDTLKSISHG
jgi:3-phosphoshikimate 1-carboxyvinyltransferase